MGPQELGARGGGGWGGRGHGLQPGRSGLANIFEGVEGAGGGAWRGRVQRAWSQRTQAWSFEDPGPRVGVCGPGQGAHPTPHSLTRLLTCRTPVGCRGKVWGRRWAGLERVPWILLRVARRTPEGSGVRHAEEEGWPGLGPTAPMTCERLGPMSSSFPSPQPGWVCPLGSLHPFRLLRTPPVSSTLPKNRCPF